jgi:hypothetical protein
MRMPRGAKSFTRDAHAKPIGQTILPTLQSCVLLWLYLLEEEAARL